MFGSNPLRSRPDGLSILFFVCVMGVMLGCDLITKRLAFDSVAGRPVVLQPGSADPRIAIPEHEQVVMIPHVLSLKLTANTGAIFGLGKGARWVFIAMTVVAAAVILGMFWQSDRRDGWLHLSLGMILAGAMGNLYDRIRYHAVRDLLYLFPDVELPFGLTWPNGSNLLYPWIFNIADTALVLGVSLMAWLMWRRQSHTSERVVAAG